MDVKAFLKDLNFTDAEITELAPKFDTPERVEALKKGQLRLSDYSKSMDGLKKDQDALKTASARLDAEMAEWATVQAQGGEITKKMRDDLDAAQLKVTQLTSRVTRIATDAGLDVTKALEGIEQEPVKKVDPPAPAIDLTGYVKADTIGVLTDFMLTLPAELDAIAREHFDLTGQYLDTRGIVTEIKARSATRGNQKPLDPRAIWEEQQQIPTKRQEKATRDHDAEITAAEQRGADRVRTEQALPIPPSTGVRSPVLRGIEGKTHESVLKRPVPESAVRSAAAALATGKYRKPAA